MNPSEIEYAIGDILMVDGPDGHVDGAEVIAQFVLALLAGKGDAWIAAYRRVNKL